MLNDFLKNLLGKINKEIAIRIIAVIAVLVAGSLVYTIYFSGEKIISQKVAGEKVISFINKNFLAGKGEASLKSVTKESGLYKIIFAYQNVDNEIYVTRDGKYMFPVMQGIPISLADSGSKNNVADSKQAPKTCADLKKNDKPAFSAFIVSKCPFGLQMQRVLTEVVGKIPALSENIIVRYMSSDAGNGKFTSMHGEDEYKENLRQICVRDEQKNKYWSYVSCFIKKGDSAGCLKSVAVNEANLNSCMNDASRGTKYIKADFDMQNKYNVTGSPTLIQNDETVSEFSFGGRTADALKTLICCGFNSQPGTCSSTLSKESAASSFSESYADSSGGSANQDSGCK